MMGIRLDDGKISKKSACRLAKSKRWCIVCPVTVRTSNGRVS